MILMLNKKDKISRRIIESKNKIKDEKKKIKIEKRNLRRKKYNKFKKTKFGCFLNRFFSVFKINDDTFAFKEVLVIIVCSLLIGAFACFSFFVLLSGGKNYFVLSKELEKFVDVYTAITENYYDEINKDELIDKAIDGMVSSIGDVYTDYVDEENTNEFDELVSGSYEGIGCTIQQQEDGVKIIEIFEDSPSEKAGLLIGDLILKIDDKDVSRMSADEISAYIKKESSEKIKMVVLRNGEEKVVNLTRDKIETPVITLDKYEKNNKKIGYMNISIFSSFSSKQFKNKLKELEGENIEGLVIDVRGNNGGYLTAVTDIASQLLLKDKNLYQIEKNGKKEIIKDKTDTSRSYPIAILVDGGSASASEILAASIKESYGGYVVGTKTYGKGTVQQTKKLSDGSMIKYTIENWLTPDGNWINEVGIEPTHEVKLTEEYYNNPKDENDNQLQKALELVSK